MVRIVVEHVFFFSLNCNARRIILREVGGSDVAEKRQRNEVGGVYRTFIIEGSMEDLCEIKKC